MTGGNGDSEAAAPAGSTGLSEQAATIAAGYAFEGAALQLGRLLEGSPEAAEVTPVDIVIPLAMLNRHGLIAGATGTGKTKTLQLLAEQLSANGVPVFAADIKGDLSGLATPGGAGDDRLLARTSSLGQAWTATAFPVEFVALGGVGQGVPIRATMTAFGPTLLAKVLELNATQESSLELVFHYADHAGLPLLDLDDLRAVVSFLVSDDGKPELKAMGGLSPATAGVILRELIGFADQGADAFFGEPEFDTAELLRVAPDGRGVVTLLELPNLQDRPAVFSTFMMWLLADLFHDLPEVGDPERPSLVFFFDEAHLLFDNSSKAFLAAIEQTVRLIRSKGVGVFFVTQSPTDVPDAVLAQVGSRIQHQLRAHTPNDAKALRATVRTYPESQYDLEKTLTLLGIGEAIVTVMSDRGAPTPVAWTRLRAPESSMAPSAPETFQSTLAASPLQAKYGTAVDRDSAQEMLATRLDEAASKRAADEAARRDAKDAKETAKKAPKSTGSTSGSRRTGDEQPSSDGGVIGDIARSKEFRDFVRDSGRTLAQEIARGVFKIGRR
jgi:DNA double-strand break repair helicase HerA and related ATPase